MRKAIFMVVLAVSVILSLILWLVAPGVTFSVQELLLILGIVLVVGFALFLALRRLRDVKNRLPAEDEMSKQLMRRAASTAYYLSLYLWLGIIFIEERIQLERSDLLGAGILGMAFLWVLSWIFHRYVSKTHD
jgi:hypothetical protein